MTSLSVLCPNAHRCKIRVTQSTQLKEVLVEACLLQGYEADSFGLQFQKKFVDLSLPFRLSGLPNNATLDLTEKQTVTDQQVQIALQTPSGRHQLEVLNSTTLLEMLKKFEELSNTSLVTMGNPRHVPSISYMNKTWKGLPVLTQTTLRSIGVESGRVLLRYSVIELNEQELESLNEEFEAELKRKKIMENVYQKSKEENEQRVQMQANYEQEVNNRGEKERLKNIEQAKRDAQLLDQSNHETAEHPRQEPDPVSRLDRLQNILSSVSTSLNNPREDYLAEQLVSEQGHVEIQEQHFANFKFPDQPILTAEQIRQQEQIKSETINVPAPERHTVLYSPMPVESERSEELDDAFFELTVDDAKKLQKHLQEEARKCSQQCLLPSSFVENRNRQRKKVAMRHTVIRLRLAENVVVQSRFKSAEPVGRLFQFAAALFQPNAPSFDLFAVTKLEDKKDKDFVDMGLAPRATITVKWRGTTFRRDFLNEVKLERVDESVANLDAQEWLSVNTTFTSESFLVDGPAESSAPKRNYPEGPIHRSPTTGPSLPKWLKKF